MGIIGEEGLGFVVLNFSFGFQGCLFSSYHALLVLLYVKFLNEVMLRMELMLL